ncbi:hypothetical protein K438DRAFT_1764557 [Mycena galopus ATCC 62051]|nr:hypothetical protein K438DRAFT_1764557 [Mycena galopus ATCC 62051]
MALSKVRYESKNYIGSAVDGCKTEGIMFEKNPALVCVESDGTWTLSKQDARNLPLPSFSNHYHVRISSYTRDSQTNDKVNTKVGEVKSMVGNAVGFESSKQGGNQPQAERNMQDLVGGVVNTASSALDQVMGMAQNKIGAVTGSNKDQAEVTCLPRRITETKGKMHKEAGSM